MIPAAWRSTQWRLALVFACAALLCGLWWTGALDPLAEPERMRRLLGESGVAGPLLWLLAFVCLQPFGMPGAVFLIPAALVWPPAVAFALCIAGATGAGLFAFGVARWLGPEAIVARLPERVQRRTARAREHGFRTAFGVRLVLFLFPPAHWALGISGIRLAPFVLGSALGFVPGMAVWVLGTRELAQRLDHLPLWEAVGLGAAVLVLAAAWLVWRRRRAG